MSESLQPYTKPPLVSLIVVTYNSASLLPAFFEALTTTVYTPYEVLVVDNASQDDTQHYLTSEHSHIRLIANPQNIGFGKACNRGAAAAHGDVLVFLNPDVYVTPDWLSILVEHTTGYHDTVILCPSTPYPGKIPQRSSTDLKEVAAVPGCAMMMRKAGWQQLGGFDENIFLYWEDTELCWRCWLMGGRVLVDPQAIVYHERGGSTGYRRWDAEQTKNSLYAYLKLMRWRRVVPFVAGLIAKTLVKILLGRGKGLWGAWTWNLKHLTQTLALRDQILSQSTQASNHLEQMIDRHNTEQRHSRQNRKKGHS